ncbi:SRPBCC family protein [uncultured Roseobacter sp.]|uniref:SRPBCC family protein n=1 Tax=uncultured Roseobacter sp. TaxID=114847 RepID=UPI00262E4795|nr:SRPBCC family protein [uncultured Roseobacter sp.]
MTATSTARLFLKLNSQYSALCGVVLVFAAGVLAPHLFANPVDWAPLGLRSLGVGLLGFAAVLYLLAKNKFITKGAVIEIAVLDGLWVLGSVVLVAFFANIFTTTGIAVVTLVAMVVAFFAVMQHAASSKIEKPIPVVDIRLQDGNLVATVKRTVNAPTKAVWDVMTDHPAYAEVADNISKVEVLSGEGLGMKRRCYGPKGESWEETCDLFEPGQSYGFVIHTEAEDYPYPFAELSGRWRVEPRQSGSEFDIRIVAKPKGNALARWLFVMMAKQQFKTILIDLADAWAARMENERRT